MFEEDNCDFPLLRDSLINDASESHLLDFPRFLCVALTQLTFRLPARHLKAFCHFLSSNVDAVNPNTITQKSLPDAEQQDFASAACYTGYFSAGAHLSKATAQHFMEREAAEVPATIQTWIQKTGHL